jgi:hypothetical protein
LRAADLVILRDNVARLGKSPLTQSEPGKRTLRALQDYASRGKIRYAPEEELDDDRGGWDGEEILIREDFRGNMVKTMPTLAHEASHVAWRKLHPVPAGKREPVDEGAEDEYLAVLHEVVVYKWLKESMKSLPEDFELENRLKRHLQGTLKPETISRYKERMEQNRTNGNH